MGIETLITAGASLLGGAMQSDAAGDAVDAQAAGTAADIAERRRQYDLTREDFAPYREAGANALKQYAGELDRMPTAAEVMAQPGYQFGLNEGQKALDRRFAASGGRISGASMKAANRFATDYATSGYNAEYQRMQDRKNRLAALAQIGQTATGSSAQAGAAAADGIGRAYSAQGDATAAARMYQGGTWANTGNQLAALYQRSRTPAGGGASFGPQLDPFFSGTGGSGD